MTRQSQEKYPTLALQGSGAPYSIFKRAERSGPAAMPPQSASLTRVSVMPFQPPTADRFRYRSSGRDGTSPMTPARVMDWHIPKCRDCRRPRQGTAPVSPAFRRLVHRLRSRWVSSAPTRPSTTLGEMTEVALPGIKTKSKWRAGNNCEGWVRLLHDTVMNGFGTCLQESSWTLRVFCLWHHHGNECDGSRPGMQLVAAREAQDSKLSQRSQVFEVRDRRQVRQMAEP